MVLSGLGLAIEALRAFMYSLLNQHSCFLFFVPAIFSTPLQLLFLLRYHLHIIKFTPLKYTILVGFSIFMKYCNQHYYLILWYFYHPENKLHQQSLPISPPPVPWQPPIYFLSLQICLFWTFYVNGIMQYMALCVWLISLSINFQGSSVFYQVSVLHSFFMAEQYSIVWRYHILFIYSWTLGCSQFLASMNNLPAFEIRFISQEHYFLHIIPHSCSNFQWRLIAYTTQQKIFSFY